MKQLIALLVVVLACFGCASAGSGGRVKIKVSGTPGARFSAHLKLSGGESQIATSLSAEPKVIVDGPFRAFECEFDKDQNTLLRVDVFEGSRRTFSFTVGEGKSKATIKRTDAGCVME